MRKLGSQLISLVVVIVLVSSMFALVLSDQITEILFHGYTEDDILVLGFAFKEVLAPIIAVVLSWVQIRVYAKSITAPISDLTDATLRIASGNFDTQIHSKTKLKEIATLQNNFNVMARELKNNEVLKKDFIANVSHEFKTPLSVIKGYADYMTHPATSESELRECAQLIATEAERLSNLTSNILKMSKLNNQEIIVSPKVISLDEQIRRSVLMLENKWSEKNIEIELNLTEANYVGDEELLSQVWLNLIDNAIKYTNPSGKIIITTSRKPNGDVLVSIRDNGIGMDEKTRCKIFEQFYQADSSHGKDGSGLGLAIVQKIVKLHHGTINVQSSPGVGSDFKVSLPAFKVAASSRLQNRSIKSK